MKNIKHVFGIDDINNLPNAIMKILHGNIEQRDNIYQQLLIINDYNLSYDWFQNLYEEELAQRNQNKQDFTPNSVGRLLSKLTGIIEGRIYEPTAGNGSMIISNWSYRKEQLGDCYLPSQHPVECWELSGRSIPILLFNLSIRNITGIVYHGDVLTKNVKIKYQLISSENYSKIIIEDAI